MPIYFCPWCPNSFCKKGHIALIMCRLQRSQQTHQKGLLPTIAHHQSPWWMVVGKKVCESKQCLLILHKKFGCWVTGNRVSQSCGNISSGLHQGPDACATLTKSGSFVAALPFQKHLHRHLALSGGQTILATGGSPICKCSSIAVEGQIFCRWQQSFRSRGSAHSVCSSHVYIVSFYGFYKP